MSDSINIDYAAVEAAISNISALVDSNGFEAEYDALLSNFSESKGDQAEAGKELINAEKKMVREVNEALKQFLNSIQMAAKKFSTMDEQEAKDMYKHNTIE